MNDEIKQIGEDDLSYFTGTEHHYKFNWNTIITDGVKFVIDNCKCHWLISDILTAWRFDNKLKAKYEDGNRFLIVEVKINHGDLKPNEPRVYYTMKEDTNTPVLYSQKYTYSDIHKYFKDGTIKFYLIDGVLILESEY